MMDLETFQSLPSAEIARLAAEKGPQVLCFPINGTRRWFLFEGHPGEDYLDKVVQRHIQVYRMLIEHGLTAILAPVFGAELLTRGPEYLQLAVQGMQGLALGQPFLDFYQACGVRVHFYGDYRRQLAGTPYAYLSDLFDQVTEQTRRNTRARMFFGVFAGDAIQFVADHSVSYFQQHGTVPSQDQVIEAYYGEHVGPVSLFIGFDKFWVFDMPLLPTDSTDLYFTISPSLYLDQKQLRSILYDHLYSRCIPEPDYESLPPDVKERMRRFYQENAGRIPGVGVLRDGIWFPA